MKQLPLEQFPNGGLYGLLLAQFENHLEVVNYSPHTISSSVRTMREYLYFLETQDIELTTAGTPAVYAYFDYLRTRTNTRDGAGLSDSYLQKHRSALVLFYDFLHLCREEFYPGVTMPKIDNVRFIPTVLTREEVQTLFDTCKTDLYGKRDKALLALYYGCGLRRKEGVRLKIENVDFERSQLFVEQSKTHRQRFVPLSEQTQKVLEDYTFNVREKMIAADKQESCFLISQRGTGLSDPMANLIIRQLVERSNSTSLKQKQPTLHTLRHSIATHLMQCGMKFESIALFLGHQSLDSTQIYTHIEALN